MIALVFVSAALPLLAKPKEKVYPSSCDKVWAAVKTATSSSHYNYAQLDDAHRKGIVSTGNALTGKRYLDITLTGDQNTCTVALGGVFSGFVHDDKGDLFGRIGEALAQPAPNANPAAPQAAAQAQQPSTQAAANPKK
ncbi:MAG: hypothetical protein ACYCSN_11995 [Acidobacteriaceae bacterium]